MDIYQESISFLGNGANFDENGLFQCELSSDTNNHDDALFLTVFKNETTINLHMSLTSPVELPAPLPETIAITIGEHALEPFRGGFGIGLMPDSQKINDLQGYFSLKQTSRLCAEHLSATVRKNGAMAPFY